ncbi:MAG: sigma 54-interacting transcriptional regulator, partial [Desulfobacteraceae bacterium]|nr:sigma 54-interacting transcriptional regulator [Desulfobacteraceae bacterium]
ELSAILQVSQVLTSSLDLERNLYAAMEILAGRLGLQRGCVFLLDPMTRELKIVVAYGLSREEIQRGKYRIGEGIVGRVIESGQPMFIPNIGAEPKFLNKTDSRPQKSGISFLCMPIALDGRTLGVISVDGIYTVQEGNVDDDLRVLSIVASFIGQFVLLWEHLRQAESECGQLRMQLKEKFSLPNIVGESTPLQQVLKLVRKVAATDTTVLLLGESGTGKELIAQTLHYQSRRAKQPFVAVNLAALPENLIEAELFGVEKGAFTGAAVRRAGRFEMADQGTIFLDEIGELPLNLQVKLLRVLQERTFERIGSSDPLTVDVRVVTATNRNLMEAVAKGTFREDLYWRLNVVPIVLPALRERPEDVPALIDFYTDKFNRLHDRRVRLHPDVVARLKTYAWPGNVRELANTMERLVIMAEKEIISESDLPANILCFNGASATRMDLCSPAFEDLGGEVQQLERRRILQALKDTRGVQQQASRILGITPRQLGYRIRKYGINLRSLEA